MAGALAAARSAYIQIGWFEAFSKEGRNAEAAEVLTNLVAFARCHLPLVAQIIAAERQTAQASHLTQRTLSVFFPGVPAEHPHAANDEAQSPSPQQPSPDVA